MAKRTKKFIRGVRGKYQTNNKEIIMEYIKACKDSFTVQDLYTNLANNNESVGLTTIYRYLDELVKNNIVMKYYDDNNTANFKYIESDNKIYLKCTDCKQIIDMQDDYYKELYNFINENYMFRLESNIISGMCNECNHMHTNIK